ncbi:hypothetical protein C8R43DRAFT_891142 [Mycena crocata]|nr:hypothetical protein C8R43DRAFT_891142 [Mycena crocata]
MRLWPVELRNAHSAFRIGEKWSPAWADCVTRFLDFEKACGYPETGPRIGGEERPSEIKDWVKGGRKCVGKLGVNGSFAARWWAWWRELQPEARQWNGGGLSCPAGLKWGRMLTLCGPNGYMQVMLALMWWGNAVDGAEDDESDWMGAVADVDFALGEMLAAGTVK